VSDRDDSGINPEYYLQHVSSYEREFKQWENRARKILKKYRDDERKDTDGARFNVLWSNVQTLKAATYSRMPRPDVSRRFRDNDPVGRVASLLLERCLDFEVKNYPDFAMSLSHVVYDRFIGGRGTAWVRYEPTFVSQQITDDAEEAVETLDFEACPTDYIHWGDFGHNVARTWEEVSIVWRKVYMGRKALVARFPEIGETIPLDSLPEEEKQNNQDSHHKRKALVYEFWDKETGQAIWISKSLGTVLDAVDDPLELEGFFPCPRPIFATLTTDTLVPVPDFAMYQDQAAELDLLADRIQGLIKALQIKGVYDASIPELARLFKEGGNGDLVPVTNWGAFAEKRGLGGAVDILEIEPIARALNEAYQAFEQIKGQIYELTGISDILRGQTAPSETATAQQIKNNYASLRLKVYQDEVERFAGELLRIKAEIICNKFDDQTILKMASVDQLRPQDQQYVQPALQLIRNNPLRHFRIEVETDSMAFQDENQDKQDRMEFLQGTAQFISQIVQAAQTAPQLASLGGELLKFGVGGFRVGKTMEGVIEQAIDGMNQAAQQAASNPHPDPQMAKVQADQQAGQARMQQEAQIEQMRMQADQAKDAQAAQLQQHIEAARLDAQAQKDAGDRQNAAMIEQLKQQFADQQSQRQIEFDRWKVQLENETKIIVAQIGAESSIRQAAVSAAAKPDSPEEPSESVGAEDVGSALATAIDGFREAIGKLGAPRTIIRDADGNISGVQ
jgi:hypothetical protein